MNFKEIKSDALQLILMLLVLLMLIVVVPLTLLFFIGMYLKTEVFIKKKKGVIPIFWP